METWRDQFKASTLRTSFQLSLTRPMLEFLSAVADGVQWDRRSNGSAAAYPDNFIAVQRALEKRGLIARKSAGELRSEIERVEQEICSLPDAERLPEDFRTWSCYTLTPPGLLVVELLKLADLFVEADAAIVRKCRRRTKRGA